nr:MAG TPA: hypothetical protein [Caudoviricetes sp.]
MTPRYISGTLRRAQDGLQNVENPCVAIRPRLFLGNTAQVAISKELVPCNV